MSNIENLGVTVEDYLAGMAAAIDILELKRLENQGIPTDLALEVMEIEKKLSMELLPMRKLSEV